MGMKSDYPIISVFGSHAPEPGSDDYQIAYRTGQLLAEAGYTVATGGYGGTMAGVSQGARDAGGHTIGVTSDKVERSRPVKLNPWIQEEIRYKTLSERVNHLVTVNQGMIVLSGGIGTLSEFALAWSFLQVKEISRRPLILVGQLWADTLRTFFDPRYVTSEHNALYQCVLNPEAAIAIIQVQVADRTGEMGIK